MATASNTVATQNSPRSRQSRQASRGRFSPRSPSGASPQSQSLSIGMVDQEQFLISSSTTSSDSPINTVTVSISPLGEDGFPTSEDLQLENGESGCAAKRPVWNKPSNGAAAEAGIVMGAEAWPALSESARASPKSPSTYFLKALSHGSISVSQDMVVEPLSLPKEVTTSLSSPTTNTISTIVVPSHSKRESVKRGDTSGRSSPRTPPKDNLSKDNLSQAPPIQHTPPHTPQSTKLGASVGEASRDNNTINKDGGYRGGSHSGNEQPPQRPFRRNYSGPLTRGDGSYHSGRRDQERGKQDWGHRSFGSRENHGSQQRTGSRPFLHGQTPNATFVPPPPVVVRPFVAPMVYTDMPSPSPVFYVPGPHPDSFRPLSMVPMPSMFFSMHDHLPSDIVKQIDYYFSNENLVKDTFLRQNMDGEGWVSVKLIAGFNKVLKLTDNIQLILDSIKESNVVEVQGDKVRRKNDWMKWIMTSVTSPQSINTARHNMLATHFNNVTLNEKVAK